MAKKPNDEVIKKKYMYIGPPIRKGFIKTHQIVEENFKEVLADEIKKVPNLEKLFIDINEISIKMAEVDRVESIYKIWIKEVINVGI